MVQFQFIYEDGSWSPHFDRSGDLPDWVASIDIHGPFDSNMRSYKVLTRMLAIYPKKIEKIQFLHLSADDSPEFLAFLVLVCNRTNSLQFTNCHLSTNAASCLKASLLASDGIRGLSFLLGDYDLDIDEAPMCPDPAKILLAGVASSPCLESFGFDVVDLDDDQDVGRCLIDALRRNKSLKDIRLRTKLFSRVDSTLFPNSIKASILGPNVKSLTIIDSERELALDVLQDALCRKDCTLEILHLQGVSISIAHGLDTSAMQNVSVTSLALSRAESDMGDLTCITRLFKSLKELVLDSNRITQLSCLDPLLLGKNSQLKSLDLRDNGIDEGEMKIFFQKLRKVRGLKHLKMEFNPGGKSESVKTALTDALWNNTDLEHFDFDCLLLDLNRGGRRVFCSAQEPFPTNLYPHLLERASKISYYAGHYDDWGRPTNEGARADVVYWLTKRILPHL